MFNWLLKFNQFAFSGLTALLILSASCVGSRSRELSSPYLKEQKSRGPQSVAVNKNSATYLASLDFDQWLKGQLPKERATQIENSCRSDSKHSPFCYSFLNFSTLETRREAAKTKQKQKKFSRIIVPKFKNGTVSNWLDLRFSSVMSSLRGLNRSKPDEIEILRKKSLAEEACPNNIAIALAAFLEDGLPNKASYSSLAELYEKGGKCPLENPGDSETLTTRAGLFYLADNQHQKAESCFKTSSQDKDAFRSRALYWLSKVYQDKGESSLARETLKELKTKYPFSFHTLMALHSNKEDPGAVLKKSNPSLITRSEQVPQLNNLIEQVELLNENGFQKSAEKVLSWILTDSEKAEPELMIYVSDLKQSQGNYLGQLQILTDVLYANPHLTTKSTMERYFPKLYFPVFEKHSQGLDPYLLMSIARRESAFNPRAVSRARAKGLMQIAPQTQRRLSSTKNAFDPEANISMGSRYISNLVKRSNGMIHLALAGYNAGPNRVDLWVARYPTSDPVLFIDLIPFRETREYVASVLRNYYWYRRLHTEDHPHSIDSILKN
jgi:soluble lytic murein transglycosylase